MNVCNQYKSFLDLFLRTYENKLPSVLHNERDSFTTVAI